ncbi:MAG: hypothetical protein KatS3mg068_0055 [Candidatus Sericytochromatia bacterium]|nr:MAG: hypothetical protein KatS3mg068_0055 [Candidatus Sericytochromatia bacterium]
MLSDENKITYFISLLWLLFVFTFLLLIFVIYNLETLFSEESFFEILKIFSVFIVLFFFIFKAHENSAIYLEKKGKINKALFHYRVCYFFFPFSLRYKYNIGFFYLKNKKLEKAEKILKKLEKLVPDDIDILNNLGFLYLYKNEFEKSYDYFLKSNYLKRGKPFDFGRIQREVNFINITKIKHDMQQLAFLVKNKILNDSFLNICEEYKEILEQNSNEQIINIPKEKYSFIKTYYGRNMYVYDKELPLKLLNNIEIKNFDKYLIIDNFLTNEALNYIYNYCLFSTIWNGDLKTGKYLCSYIDDGLNHTKFIFNLVRELQNFKVFRELKLIYAWAYKYDFNSEGIPIHSDKAKININFWITPQNSNNNQNNSGLIIYDILPTEDWTFYDYNSNTEKIKQFIKENKPKEIIIPYKENRAVIFNSKLFHKTDKIDFKNSYENRRINITLLFE